VTTSDVAARLRRVYERFAAGDAGPMAEFLADDVVYQLPGRHLGGGTIRGRDALFERTARAADGCDAPPRIALIDVVASETLAVSLERITARRRGRTLEQEACVVWRLVDGRCVEMWSHFADQEECDRFWGDA
jgi:ketosteroid isomerase-like protein